MNCKVPGAMFPLGCACLSTSSKNNLLEGKVVVATPLWRTGVKCLDRF